MTDDPLKPLRELGKVVEDNMKGLGLEMMNFAIRPSKDGQDDYLEVVLAVRPEALMSAEEIRTKEELAMFEAITSGVILDGSEEPEPEEPDNLKAAREALEKWSLDE